VKQLHARNAAYDQILKKNEQMYALLALVVGLCPAVQNTLDEHVLVALKDKFGEKLQVTMWHCYMMLFEWYLVGIWLCWWWGCALLCRTHWMRTC
jgi:hypothetical protein